MKFVCIWLLLFPVFAIAQSSKPGTILWKITAPGSQGRVSYVIGTNHSYGGTFIDTFPQVAALLKTAECVVLESVRKPVQETKPSFTGKTPYSKLFSPADYRMMDSVLASYGMDKLEELDSVHFPPHLLCSYLTMNLVNEKDNRMKKEDESVDNYFLRYAQKEHLPLAGLDSGFTVREGILEYGLTEQQWADGMVKLFSAKRSGEEVMSNIDGSYATMDIDYMFKKPQPHAKGSDIYHLMVERNAHWMKSLPVMLKSKPCFVAVGVGHLMYKQGLLMELKKQGFKVEPVSIRQTANI
ncbi:TraB/GumN family protein [Chitinophaga barathri]|uniref:TraB/GumN family protein n=1 Tax=Chitinophaga barathri TaxID=1647451 RepID=A0A3N4MGC7_9BACT|nr:TraB/GumN family protein [Chitinophaga barathri]RPD39150.1 TraB/GumN family protein [Chitinophaga barathri]